MTEAEPSSNGVGEIDIVNKNLSQDATSALIQKLDESPDGTTLEIPDAGIDPKNATDATQDNSPSENINESETVIADDEGNTSSGKDLDASSISSLKNPETFQSSEVHKVTTEDDPLSVIYEESHDEENAVKESEKTEPGDELTLSTELDASKVGETHEAEDNQATSAVETVEPDNATSDEKPLASNSDEEPNLSHEEPSEKPFGGADEIASSNKGAKVFPEADPTESTEVAANQEEKILSNSAQDDTVSINDIHVIIPENVLTEPVEETSNPENEHVSSVNIQSPEANELNSSEAETAIETLENEDVTSLEKEAGVEESDETSADPGIQDPLNEKLEASNDVNETQLSEVENITIYEQEISNSNKEVNEYAVDPIEITENSTPLEDEGDCSADCLIPEDSVNPTLPHELAETTLADEQSSTSSENKAEISEGDPTGSIEAAEKQESEAEISPELGVPSSGPENASEKPLPNAHDVTSSNDEFTEEADRTVLAEASEKDETEADSSTAQPISEEANQPIISHEEQSENAPSNDQDIHSSSPEDEISQTADLTATSEAAEKQELESDSLEEQSIPLDAINPTVYAPLPDGHDITEHSQEVENSQEDVPALGAEAAEKQAHDVDSSVDIAVSDPDNTVPTLPHDDLIENSSPDEPNATNSSMVVEISNEVDESESLEATEKQHLEADLSAKQLSSEETIDPAIGDKEKVEKASPDEVDLTNSNHEVEISQEVDPTENAEAAEEQEVQADLKAELPSVENTIEPSSPELAHKSSIDVKEIKSTETEEADGKESTDAFANEPDRTVNMVAAADCDGHSDLIATLLVPEKADEQIPSYSEALTANEQVSCSSKEAEISPEQIGVSEIVSVFVPDGLADLIDAHNTNEKDEEEKLGTDADGITNPEIASGSPDQVEQDSTPADAAVAPVLSRELEASLSDTASESIAPPAATSDERVTLMSDVTAGGYDPDGANPSETESIHTGISALQKEENVLLPETEAFAPITATPVAIVQEKAEGQDLLAISDDVASNKADFQDTPAVPVSEKEVIEPVEASNANVETPILEKSDALESHKAIRIISNEQEGGSADEKVSDLETTQAGALLNGADKGCNVGFKDTGEIESLDETDEVSVPASLQTELKYDLSHIGDYIAPVVGNVPEVLETSKSGTFKEFADDHEQVYEQSNEVGIEKDHSDLQNGVDSKLTSSSPAREPGHGEETSGEQLSSLQDSVLDLNGEKVIMNSGEGDNVLSGKEESVREVKLSTEVTEYSTRELGLLERLIKQNSENHFEEEVKDKRLEGTDTSDTLSVDKEQADLLKSVIAEQPAPAVYSEKLAKVSILPVSTSVTSSFLDSAHPKNYWLADAKQIIEKPQGSDNVISGSGNGAPTQSKSEVSSEKLVLQNIEETSQTNGSNDSKDVSLTETHTTNGNLPDKALGAVNALQYSVGSPATDVKSNSQVRVEEEKTKSELSFPWSILLCCSSVDR